jgi:hypothetical protein
MMDERNGEMDEVCMSKTVRRILRLQKLLSQRIGATSAIHCVGDRTLSELNKERESLLIVRLKSVSHRTRHR